MIEINPLVITKQRNIVALDAKMSFDDNALYRRPQIAELRDKSQEDPRETYASDRGLAYVGLDGDIGCIVNGAGLAMATLDMIKLAGGEPANFLDIGGGASPERVTKSCKAVLRDKHVKAILVNVFAGINRGEAARGRTTNDPYPIATPQQTEALKGAARGLVDSVTLGLASWAYAKGDAACPQSRGTPENRHSAGTEGIARARAPAATG